MIKVFLLGGAAVAALGTAALFGPGQVAPVLQQAAPAAAVAQSAPVITYTPSGDAVFDAWRDAFTQRAIAAGRNPDVVRRLLQDVTPDPRIVSLDQNQAEFVRPVWDYIDRAVSDTRITGGQQRLAENRAVFDAVEARFGVDAAVIAGIWAVETNFGAAPLPHSAPRAIATLAAEGRRRDTFERYMTALIQMVERGYAGENEMRSSWAGALGQPQFMPDVYLELAVDWDGDGRRDIWNNLGDVFASIANYLSTRGRWQRGAPVFDEVDLPSGFDYAQADGVARPIQTWTELGVRRIGGGGLPAAVAQAQLFLPAGARGPALLLYPNFAAIRSYNPSDRYALAVALLARGFRGEQGLVTRWPRDIGALDRQQTVALQMGLTALGYAPGTADGMFGSNTRRAVRAYQQAKGLPADGYPTPALLARITSEIDVAERSRTAASSPALDEDGVRALQRAFNRAGISVGRVDGQAGEATIRAVRTLERRLGVPQTGNPTEFILTEAQKLDPPPRPQPRRKRRR